MGRPIVLPRAGREWMTDEIRGLLGALRGRHAPKKRATVVKLAFARAQQVPLAGVFRDPEVCSESIWYEKWQYDPLIKAAYRACYERALEWGDEETAALEAHYSRERRRSVAEYAAAAPAALAAVMSDGEQKGADRISAADTLMRWAEPETAERIGQAGASVRVDASFERALERVYGGRDGATEGTESTEGESGR